jgi:hypothetical protein
MITGVVIMHMRDDDVGNFRVRYAQRAQTVFDRPQADSAAALSRTGIVEPAMIITGN